MRYHTTLSVLAAVGLSAPMALADSFAISSLVDRAGPNANAYETWVAYIGGVAGPSNHAPRLGATARSDISMNSYLSFMLTGPSNASTGETQTFQISAGELGDGPGLPGGPTGLATADLTSILTPVDHPVVVTKAAPPPQEGPGTFQVVVPLPGAGALAAGGLAIVALRRRR